jgi:TfoX/Sxy family transcriptional regulator of competence genes
MATSSDYITFITDQVADAGVITARKMFGEYALYCDGKVVALVCDDKLYVKRTDAGVRYIGTAVEKPAYPGARPSLLIEEKIDDRAWLSELIRITCSALPEPKPKRTRAKKHTFPVRRRQPSDTSRR